MIANVFAMFVATTVQADDDFTRLAEMPSAEASNAETSANTQNEASPHLSDASANASLWNTLGRYSGPIVLGVSALGVAAFGIYALLPPTCAMFARDGICLRGEDPNGPAGAALLVSAGVLALGALIWTFLVDSPAQEPTRIVDNSCTPAGLCFAF